jgi:hypothetical protein
VVGPPLAAAPIAFWDNGETTVDLMGSRRIGSEEYGVEKGVVLAKMNKRRLLKIIWSVLIVVISCVVAYSPP